MSKPVKELIMQDLATRYEGVDSALWLEFLGVDGNTTNDFRRDLHSKNLHMEIVKTLLFKRACSDGPIGRLAEHLNGPAAIVIGGDSAIDAAKVIDDWKAKIKGLKLRGALLEGEFLNEKAAEHLHKMPNKADLQAKIAAAVLSPGANLSAAMLSGGANIAGCLKAIIKKHEDGGEAAAA